MNSGQKLKRTKVIAALVIALFSIGVTHENVQAQKYASVNTEYVLKNLPDYVQAQKRLDQYVSDWQSELDEKYQEVEALSSSFQQEIYLLPDNLKKRREEDIKAKKEEILALQKQRFAPGGDLEKKRAELMKPVEDRVYNAIERIAREKNYAFVFDRAGNATILFANEKYDISNQVLEMLGYRPGEDKGDGSQEEGRKKPENPAMKR